MAGTMEKFCGTKFWDLNLTWNTDNPDFTPCFEQTILVWIPCVFLWIFMFMELYYLKASLDKNIPWNWKNISKVILLVALHGLCIYDFVEAFTLKDTEENLIYPVDIWTPVIKFVTFAIAVIFVFLNRKYGVQTSGTLFMFWFFLVICAAPQLRTEIRLNSDRHDHSSEYTDAQMAFADYKFISFIVFFSISCVLLFLNCFADDMPRETKYNRTPKEIPEVSASFLSRMTFSWFDKMAWAGYRKPLTQKDLWELRPQDGSKEIMPLFAKHWNANVRKNFPGQNRENIGQSTIGNVRFENPYDPNSTKLASVMSPIVKSFGGMFLFGSILKLVTDLLTFASPKILNLIIGYVNAKASGTETEPVWRGIFYAILLFCCAVIQTFFSAQYFQKMYTVGLRTRTALVNAIYRKALVISNATKKNSTAGEIVNLMAVDAQRFLELVTYVSMIWSAPLTIALALYFLWELLGVAVLAGLVVMIILIPINLVIAGKSKKLQVKQMKFKDERVKIMNEILAGMKVLKLYAWEPCFEDIISQIRDKEIKQLRAAAYLSAGTSFVWSCAPYLVSLVTFATYVLIDENNVLDASNTIVSISLFNILRFPLAMLPMLISNLIQTQVSIRRINKFLNSEELDPNCVSHDKSAPHPMMIEHGTFTWGDDVILKDINIEIKRQTLVAIVGSVGTGKSSLIAAFLGEMEKIKGKVNTLGSIAYVPQQAWMQNATLRDNILFGKPYDRKRYNRVVDACALRADFQMLAAGDQTEIGEKGINLSGGQKQRISLARAVYSESDLYILDDPLSAVDSHVGKHIFEQVIGPTGLLANKTRVLVTHGITYLPKVDNIYVLKGGEVSEDGTYSELLNQKGAFAEFLIQHLTENSDEIEELDEIAEQLENTITSAELRSKFVRAISRARSDSIDETASIRSFGSGRGSIRRSIKEKAASNGSLRKRNFSRQESIASISSKLSDLAVGKDEGKLIEVEKSQEGGVRWAVYKQYIQSIGVALAIGTLVLNVFYQGFSIGSNLWLTQWSTDDRVATDTGLRNMYLGVYAGFGLGQVLVDFSSSLCLALGCIYCSKALHEFLMKNAIRFPMDYFDTTPLGRILNRFSKDVDTVDNILPLNLRMMISQFFSVIATITVICISTPIFLAAIVPMALIYWFAQRFYVATSRQLMRLESVTRSPIYSHFSETVTGVTTIRAYGVGGSFIDESDSRVDLNQLCKYPSIVANRWLSVRLETIGNLVILLASLLAVLGDQKNAALVGLSVTYSLQITQTLNMLVRVSSDIETNIVSVERIKEYGDIKQEAPWEIAEVKTPQGWPQGGRVTFENYMVRYREGLDLVLKGVTFDISGGEKVGIVGRTGAGKSSLTLCLFRIIEAAGGRITIDGVDISKLGLHLLRSRLTIIPQDPVLFSGSLRMNLDPYNRNSDAEIWSALELSHLKEFVKSQPAGLLHEINEGGENLSVGQRQLVCLARALLRKTKVLVLDEATAAVDLETDDLIQKTIRTEFKDCTVLTIAHRLNTILDSDKVIVLDKGEIIEFASPTSLLQDKNSSFYSMAKDANLV
ncbi:ATP-binding cassette sub-family C member 3-like [Episyrphus balteatus]|uniref:ATP-binding cassette sub-family C member 3-like n=1 Tax=Episyrphus balteatus TaxID=286459 RepID=UPI00248545DD|nr:ATP-binding cassette sub-family C member 3-like [Episyrphus balteatus]